MSFWKPHNMLTDLRKKGNGGRTRGTREERGYQTVLRRS
jgi:hypothetical protein